MTQTRFQQLAPWLWLAPVLLALLANFNVLQNGFGWDDELLIPNLALPEDWWSLFLPDSTSALSGKEKVPYFRPLVSVSYLLDHLLWGDNPFGFHFSVLLSHLLNTALVYFLAQRLSAPRQAEGPSPITQFLPFIAASVFAVHPVHAEAVAWIAGRNDVFCTTFMLSSLIFYLRFHATGRWTFYGLAMLSFALALLTKETAVGLVLLFPLYDYLTVAPSVQTRWRQIGRRLVIPPAILGFYFWMRTANIADPLGRPYSSEMLSLATVWEGIRAVGFYLKLILFPYPHNPFIAALPASQLFSIQAVLIMGLLLYGLIFALYRREVLLGIGLAWTVFLLSPGIAVTVFDLIWSKAAERYTYGPSAGLLIVCAWFALKGLEKLPTTTKGPKQIGWITASVLLSALVGLWGWESFHRNRVWQSPEIFWRAALAATTQKGFPDRQLGNVYEGLGRYEEAEEFYRKAVTFWEEASGKERDRFLDDVLLDLAELYFFQHRYAEAEPLYQRVLALREKARGKMDYAVAAGLDNLARLYYTQERYAEAEPLYRRSLMIMEKTRGTVHPDTATSLNNLAVLVQAQNRTSEAEELYQRSLAIREKSLRADHPDLAASLENYASLLRKLNRLAEAVRMEARAEMIRNKQP